MLTRFGFLLFIVFLSLSFLSCGDCSKKIDCPGYKDDTLDRWFPYRDNQRIIFRSNTNLEDTLTLKNTETTQPYQLTTGPFTGPRYCNARKVFESIELDTFKRAKAYIELNSREGVRTVYYTIGNNGFNIYNLPGSGLGQITAGSRSMLPQALPVATTGSVTFYNVIEAVGDTVNNKDAGFYKLYYKQGEGLVSYSEYPSLQTWIKQ